jgi:hypothetical protein
MNRRKTKPTPPKPAEVHQVSPKLQAGIDGFARALGHLVLVKVDPEAARRMAEEVA